MDPLDVFTVRDLRARSGDLLRDAEAGRLALITKHGRPALLAIPFDQRLITHGVNRALALHLFETGQLTPAQAAKIAGVSLEAFLELLQAADIPAVNYPAEELDEELQHAS